MHPVILILNVTTLCMSMYPSKVSEEFLMYFSHLTKFYTQIFPKEEGSEYGPGHGEFLQIEDQLDKDLCQKLSFQTGLQTLNLLKLYEHFNHVL